ncbi:MAG: type-F conjugative transfer system pilin assembly protein TrbC [Thermodesulfobacteriota bacterium]
MHPNHPKNWKRVIGAAGCAVVLVAGSMNAGDQSLEAVNRALDQAQKMQTEIDLSKALNKAGEAAAGEAFDRFQSRPFQEKIESEKNRIAENLLEPLEPGKTDNPENQCPDRLLQTEKVFLFISSSMPEQTLRAYARDLDRLGDPHFVMVLRGFVDGMKQARPTLDFLEKLLVKESGCRLKDGNPCASFRVNIQIDPLVFQKLGVQQVPAVAYVKNIHMVDSQQSFGLAGNLEQEPDAVVVYGDASLDHTLERILAETGNRQLKKTIQKLREDFYEG